MKIILKPFIFLLKGFIWPFKKILTPLFRPTPRGKVRLLAGSIFILAILAGFLDYPIYYNQTINWLNLKLDKVRFLEKINLPHYWQLPFHLGLDLQGGTHLVYDADTTQIPDNDKDEALEGVRDVIERRVNTLGVTEPVIQTNKSGSQWRVIVELAGVKDVHEAIQMIGETPFLEFKEENTQPSRELTEEEKKELEEYNQKAQERAEEILKKALEPDSDFIALVREYSQDSATKDQEGDLGFIKKEGSHYDLYQQVENEKIGEVVNRVLLDSQGYNIVKILEKRSEEKEVKASHILICFQGAERCEKDYSKEEARSLIEDLKNQARPENFIDLAKEHSTEPGAQESGGELGWFSRGMMVASFEEAAFRMETGTISEIIETKFGFHLIYKTDERPLVELHLARILVKKKEASDILPPPEPWRYSGLSGKELKRAEVQFDPNTGSAEVGLEFNDDGKKLFAEITERNIGKPVAIFLDGLPISIPRVNEPIKEGRAVITGSFNLQEAKLLAQRLNAGALPVPIKLVSQQTVGASLGKLSIEKSLQAALIGVIAIALFMIFYYRLSGLLAVIALGIYAAIVLAVFKLIPVTLTLAGMAGFILSIGMAVDANILIFERMKEELRKGMPIGSASPEGFRRAWPSIRDSNVSTLITCFILGTFGTSMVKGFAITLGLGVIISMFSAIVATNNFLRLVGPWVKGTWVFGVKRTNS